MNRPISDILHKQLMESEVAHLTSLFSSEVALVEAYNEAIQHVKDIDLIGPLEECRDSHAERVAQLRERLKSMAIYPKETGGFWSGFTKILEASASMLSDRAAMAVLHEEEEKITRQYLTAAQYLDPYSYRMVERILMPAQRETERSLNVLRKLL